MLDCQLCIHTSKGPIIIMIQLKSINNSPFRRSYSLPIHTCFPTIASNDQWRFENILMFITDPRIVISQGHR